MGNMDLTEIKNWDVRDLNHALMAAIMAQQLERERAGGTPATVPTSTPTTVTSSPTVRDITTMSTDLAVIERIEENELSGKIINQIVTGSVFILLEVLMIVSYVILINHNRIDYRKRMIYILILICTRELTLSIIQNKINF